MRLLIDLLDSENGGIFLFVLGCFILLICTICAASMETYLDHRVQIKQIELATEQYHLEIEKLRLER